MKLFSCLRNSKKVTKQTVYIYNCVFIFKFSLFINSAFSRPNQVQQPVRLCDAHKSPQISPQSSCDSLHSMYDGWWYVEMWKKWAWNYFFFGVIKCKLYRKVTDAIWCIFIASYCFAPTEVKSPPSPIPPFYTFSTAWRMCAFNDFFFFLAFLRGLFFSTRHYLCVHVWHFLVIEISFDSILFFLEKNTQFQWQMMELKTDKKQFFFPHIFPSPSPPSSLMFSSGFGCLR